MDVCLNVHLCVPESGRQDKRPVDSVCIYFHRCVRLRAWMNSASDELSGYQNWKKITTFLEENYDISGRRLRHFWKKITTFRWELCSGEQWDLCCNSLEEISSGNHRFAGLVLHVSNEIRIGRETWHFWKGNLTFLEGKLDIPMRTAEERNWRPLNGNETCTVLT